MGVYSRLYVLFFPFSAPTKASFSHFRNEKKNLFDMRGGGLNRERGRLAVERLVFSSSSFPFCLQSGCKISPEFQRRGGRRSWHELNSSLGSLTQSVTQSQSVTPRRCPWQHWNAKAVGQGGRRGGGENGH